MKKFKTVLAVMLFIIMAVSVLPGFALAEEACACGGSYDENGVCLLCGNVRERSCDTVYCEKGKLTVSGRVPLNVTPVIEPVYVSEDNVIEWSGIPNASDLCYRMYDLSLVDNVGEAYLSDNPMLTMLNPEFAVRVTSVRIFRIYEIELKDEYGNPYIKTVGEELTGTEWNENERVIFSYSMPERWLIVGTPDAWGLLTMRLARLNGLAASSDDAEYRLLAVDEAAQILRNQGVTDEELFHHEGLDWTQYNWLRSSVLVEKTLTSGNVTVSGLMPASAWLEVSNVSKADLGEYIEGRELVFAYDITVKYGKGFEYQPGETNPLKVLISDAGASVDTVVTHIEDANTAENIASSVNADGSVVFEAESFSVYIGTTVAEAAEPNVSVDFGDEWEGLTNKCGDSPKIKVTVRNTGTANLYDVTVVSDSEAFVITGWPFDNDEANKLPVECRLDSVAPLVAGNYAPTVTVSYKYRDGEKEKTGSQTFSAPSFSISHNFWGGWCLYAGCDCRDDTFTGTFTYGTQRTYFQNSNPDMKTNLVFFQYDENGEDVLRHSFTLLVDGKTAPDWGYELYRTDDNCAGVKIKNDFLISLKKGRHTVRLTETDNNPNNPYHTQYALSWFRISSAVDTGDEDMMRVATILICGLLGAAACGIEYKRRKKE